MWTTRTIALAAGVATSIAAHSAPGTIIISSVSCGLSGSQAGGINIPPIDFVSQNPSLTTFVGPRYNGSLFLAYSSNYISGIMRLRADFNYPPLIQPHEQRWVRYGLTITFTTDEPVNWQCSATGFQNAQYTEGEIDFGPYNPVIGPGSHTFRGQCIVGAVEAIATNGYADLWFGIPSPAAPATLLCAGLILSIRRRRSNGRSAALGG